MQVPSFRPSVRFCGVLLLGVVLAGASPCEAAESSPRQRVRTALSDLHGWLDRHDQGPRWRRYLRSDDLLVELSRGADADGQTVLSILDRYESGVAGLGDYRFERVREALRDWQEELEPASLETLPELVRNAAPEFEPVTQEDVAAARRQLERALKELRDWLATGSRQNREGWSEHLRLEDLERELAAEGRPDLRALSRVLGQFFEDEEGLEIEQFLTLRQALRQYMYAVLYDSPALQQAYPRQLQALAQRLESYQRSGSAEDRAEIGRLVGWLDQAGQAEAVVRAVRRRFAYPNIWLQVSEGFISRGFRDDVRRVAPVRETILGTAVRGQALTTGTLTASLVSDDERAALRLNLIGTAVSDNVGFNRGVRIYSNGRTRIQAGKVLYVDGDQLLEEGGLFGVPATADCQTDTQLRGVSAHCGLIERIAWKQAQRQRSAAERIASRRAEERVARQVDEQAGEFLAESRQRFRRRVRGPLRRRDALPRRFQLRTSTADLLVRVLQTSIAQVAAPSLPPALVGSPDLSLRLHETAVGNFSESALGGRTVTDGELRRLLKENNRPIPEALSEKGDPWSITFSSEQPISTEFRESGIRIALRGRRFTRARSAISDEAEISAVYQIRRGGPGESMFVRQGDVQVDFVGRESLSLQQVAFKSFLQSKFRDLFDEDVPLDQFELPGRWKQVGTLALDQAQSTGGWLTVAWRVAKSQQTPSPRVARRD